MAVPDRPLTAVNRPQQSWLRLGDWPVSTKIFSAVMVTAIVALGVGVLGIVRIQQLRDRAQDQYHHGAMPLIHLDAIRNATLLLRNDITAYCLAADAAALTKQGDKVAADGKAVTAAMDAYRGFVMALMMAEVLQLARVGRSFPGNWFWGVLAFNQSHVPWAWASLHDLIQPSFSFLVGVALPYSIASRIAIIDNGRVKQVAMPA